MVDYSGFVGMVIWIFLGILGLLVVVFLSVWLYFKKKGGKNLFIFYPRNNPNKPEVYNGVVVKDEDNKKVFSIKGLDAELPLFDATLFIKGQGYRQISRDQKGDVAYLTTIKIDNKVDLELGLAFEDRELAIRKSQVFANRYDTFLNKTQQTYLFAMVLMTVITCATLISALVITFNGISSITNAIQELAPITEAVDRSTTSLNLATQQLASIQAAGCGSDTPLVRQLT